MGPRRTIFLSLKHTYAIGCIAATFHAVTDEREKIFRYRLCLPRMLWQSCLAIVKGMCSDQCSNDFLTDSSDTDGDVERSRPPTLGLVVRHNYSPIITTEWRLATTRTSSILRTMIAACTAFIGRACSSRTQLTVGRFIVGFVPPCDTSIKAEIKLQCQ